MIASLVLDSYPFSFQSTLDANKEKNQGSRKSPGFGFDRLNNRIVFNKQPVNCRSSVTGRTRRCLFAFSVFWRDQNTAVHLWRMGNGVNGDLRTLTSLFLKNKTNSRQYQGFDESCFTWHSAYQWLCQCPFSRISKAMFTVMLKLRQIILRIFINYVINYWLDCELRIQVMNFFCRNKFFTFHTMQDISDW